MAPITRLCHHLRFATAVVVVLSASLSSWDDPFFWKSLDRDHLGLHREIFMF